MRKAVEGYITEMLSREEHGADDRYAYKLWTYEWIPVPAHKVEVSWDEPEPKRHECKNRMPDWDIVYGARGYWIEHSFFRNCADRTFASAPIYSDTCPFCGEKLE